MIAVAVLCIALALISLAVPSVLIWDARRTSRAEAAARYAAARRELDVIATVPRGIGGLR